MPYNDYGYGYQQPMYNSGYGGTGNILQQGAAGFASGLQNAVGSMYGILSDNAERAYRNNLTDAQFAALKYQLDQQAAQNAAQNALAGRTLDAQSSYNNAALQGNLGLGNRQIDYMNSALQGNLGLQNRGLDLQQDQTNKQYSYLGDALAGKLGVDNRSLDLQGSLGNRQLGILEQEQANKLAIANSRNSLLDKLFGSFGGWLGGTPTPAPGGATAPTPSAPTGGGGIGGPTPAPQPAGFQTNYGQRATYTPRRLYGQVRGAA